MSRFAIACALALLPTSAFAADVCDSYMAALGIPAPPPSLTDQAVQQVLLEAVLPLEIDPRSTTIPPDALELPEMVADPDCTLPELAMLRADWAAVNTAVPPADPKELAGTWVSDDVLLPALGLTVLGREVLVIGQADPADPDSTDPLPGALSISQYWYQTDPAVQKWNEDGSYAGLVVSGHLILNADQAYQQDMIEPSLIYSNAALSSVRVDDLYIKARLNLFDRPVGFALAGDTLVLSHRYVAPLTRLEFKRQSTYHRINEGSPDRALRIVNGLQVSGGLYFNCLLQAISTDDPALPAVFAPLTLDELEAQVTEYDAMKSEMFNLGKQMQAGGDKDALTAQLNVVIDRLPELSAGISAAELALRNSDICPPPPGLR